jgi:hypothetical protein
MAKDRTATRIRKTFLTDKAPYIITVFFAALAWTVVRTVDRLSGLPVIQYQTSVQSTDFLDSQAGQMSTIRLRNITSATTFECLIFVVQAEPPGSTYVFDKPADSRYIVRGTAVASGTVTVETPYLVQIKLERFWPGSDIEFGVTSFGNGAMTTKVQRCRTEDEPQSAFAGVGVVGKPEKDSPFPVLLENGWQTSFVEHETYWLWGALLLWGLLLVILLIVSACLGDDGTATETPDAEV